MQKTNYLIIGGGIAGTTAAEFIRMNDESGSITIISEESEPLYSRVMLPYYLRDQTPFGRLYLRKPEQYKEKRVEMIKGVRAIKIDIQNRIVYLSHGQNIQYNKLLIASGGKVNRLEIPGADLAGVTYLRKLEDVKVIKKLLRRAKNAVVIGGGFIGIDFAEIFIKAGLNTTCMIREPYFWSSIVGENMGKFINKILEKNGVKIIPEATTDEFLGSKKLEAVRLSNSNQISADIAGVGIGIHMNLSHLKNSGLKINKGVVTNEYLETDIPNVWAAGDITEFYDPLFDKHHQMGNWSNAAAQGKVVGSNMVVGWGGKNREEFRTVSAYTTLIFSNSFTFIGDMAIDDGTEIIERGLVEDGKIGRIHLRDGAITGAALINLPADRRPIEELIRSHVRITVDKERVTDTSFNLSKLT
jgi:NAD(P)H-nitrite reductase large subunit